MYPSILSRSNTNEQHLVKWHLKWQVSSNKWQVRAKNVILTTKQTEEYLLRDLACVPNMFSNLFPIVYCSLLTTSSIIMCIRFFV